MGTRATILLVDDDPAILGLLGSGLHEYGFAVATAASAGEALRLLPDRFTPVVTDVRLLGSLDGLDMLQVMRDGGWQGPAVVITSLADNTIERRADAVGATDIIEKPVSPALLANRLRELLPSQTSAG